MKYFVLLTDGMSDHRLPELGDKTIMEYANMPNLHGLAEAGTCGLVRTTPEGMYPGSDICNLSVFGYDPRKYYSGRSPLEAASIGVELGPNDMSFRCNFVTLTEDGATMDDFSAHHIDADKAETAIARLSELFGSEGIEFYSGVGYRNLMVMRDVDFELTTTPPHDIMGQSVEQYLPEGKGREKLRSIMARARQVFADGDLGRANAIWLWGEGRRPNMPAFRDLYGVDGSVVAAVDLIKGIGTFAGLNVIDVPGATGFIDTDYNAKARYAVKSLDDADYVYVHVEAPDEAGHMGSIEEKVKAVESIDKLMLPAIIDGLVEHGDWRILVMPDHATPVKTRTHEDCLVPALLAGTGVSSDVNTRYTEYITPSFTIEDGYRIAEKLIKTAAIVPGG